MPDEQPSTWRWIVATLISVLAAGAGIVALVDRFITHPPPAPLEVHLVMPTPTAVEHERIATPRQTTHPKQTAVATATPAPKPKKQLPIGKAVTSVSYSFGVDSGRKVFRVSVNNVDVIFGVTTIDELGIREEVSDRVSGGGNERVYYKSGIQLDTGTKNEILEVSVEMEETNHDAVGFISNLGFNQNSNKGEVLRLMEAFPHITSANGYYFEDNFKRMLRIQFSPSGAVEAIELFK